MGDRVWFDRNGNGIQDSDEEGVQGVTVTLWSHFGQEIATTITDGYGYYLFTDLQPGEYWLKFTPPTGYRFTVRDQGENDAWDSDVEPHTGLTIPTTLEAGEVDLHWDAGLIEILGGNEPTKLEETAEPSITLMQPQLWLPMVSNVSN